MVTAASNQKILREGLVARDDGPVDKLLLLGEESLRALVLAQNGPVEPGRVLPKKFTRQAVQTVQVGDGGPVEVVATQANDPLERRQRLVRVVEQRQLKLRSDARPVQERSKCREDVWRSADGRQNAVLVQFAAAKFSPVYYPSDDIVPIVSAQAGRYLEQFSKTKVDKFHVVVLDKFYFTKIEAAV